MSIGLIDHLFFENFIRKHNLAVEELTERQLAEALRQAIYSGDFRRHVMVGTNAQAVTYIPYSELERVRGLYHELLFAVARKFDDETRHETALRYIREAEGACKGGECKNAE